MSNTPAEKKVLDKAREFRETVRDMAKVRKPESHSQPGDRLSSLDREDSARKALVEAAKELP